MTRWRDLGAHHISSGYRRGRRLLRRQLGPIAHRLRLTGPYRGNLDGLVGDDLFGWVIRNRDRSGGLRVGLFSARGLLTEGIASGKRPDIAAAAIGDEACGFNFKLNEDLRTAIADAGGVATIRVLDAKQTAVGHYDIVGLAALNLDPSGSTVSSLRTILHGDLEVFDTIRAGSLDPFFKTPKLRWSETFFTRKRLYPRDRQNMGETAPVSAYLDYIRHKYAVAGNFDIDGVPEDKDHFLDWYIRYHRMADGLRPPLGRGEIDYLNETNVMAGQVAQFSRVMWWNLLRDRDMLSSLSGTEEDVILVAYWWAWETAPRFLVEDCLVRRGDIERLRSIRPSVARSPQPISRFMEMFHSRNPHYHFLDLARPADRHLLGMAMIVMAFRRPDVLQFMPTKAIDAAFSRDNGPSPVERFLSALLQTEITLDRAMYDRMLRQVGYDAQAHRFLYRTVNGDRLHAAGLAVPGADDPKVDVQLIGPIRKASGLGQAMRLSAEILDQTGLEVVKVSSDLDNPAPVGFNTVGETGSHARAKINLIQLNAESVPLAYGYEPDVFSDAYNIGYFFWELSDPALCHYLGMELLDEIWVSTEYGVDIYAGETAKPVRNVGMSVEMIEGVERRPARDALNTRYAINDDTFVFFVAFDTYSFVPRKNPVAVLQAFLEAFPDEADVRIILKSQNRQGVSDKNQMKLWSMVDDLMAKDDRIITMNETLSYDDLIRLKASCDCYVSLHRSEGWGFGMIEAMNLKVPVICTGYSGNLAFCSEDTAWLVDYDLRHLEPGEYIYVRPSSVWAEPRISHAAAQMRAVRANKEDRERRAAAAFEKVRTHFSSRKIARSYGARLKEILQTL
ncbi:MAG: glycosyltransferase [Pseudomonadota bacterium]